MFYRKYRPQSISELDNAAAREIFGKIFLDKKEFPHAFLLTGPKGIGKTSTARIIAKLINCTSAAKTKPCNECDSCKSITNGNNMDVMEMDAASNRGIEEIRELKDKIRLSPSSLKYKVYIIDEVHMLTTEAFNALLKTLEEPPEHAVFILCTTNPEKIPETIISRCLRFDFRKAGVDELKRALDRVVTGEKLEIENEILKLIIDKADGSFRDAVKNLEQLVSVIGRKIGTAEARKFLTGNTEFNAEKFVDMIVETHSNASVQQMLQIINDYSDKGGDAKDLVTNVLQVLEIMLKDKAVKGEATADLITLIKLFDEAYGQIRGAAVPILPVEIAVIEWCQPRMTNDKIQITNQIQNFPPSGGTPPKAVAKNNNNSTIFTLEQLQSKWPDILTELKTRNHSLQAFMRSAKPIGVEGSAVVIEVFYPFHKQKLEEQKCAAIAEEVIGNVMGSKIVVKYVLGKKEKKEDLADVAEEIFKE
ncbi:MAG: DNA polymerase III subunit gamma/tau [Patescibacteria group bacterium]